MHFGRVSFAAQQPFILLQRFLFAAACVCVSMHAHILRLLTLRLHYALCMHICKFVRSRCFKGMRSCEQSGFTCFGAGLHASKATGMALPDLQAAIIRVLLCEQRDNDLLLISAIRQDAALTTDERCTP